MCKEQGSCTPAVVEQSGRGETSHCASTMLPAKTGDPRKAGALCPERGAEWPGFGKDLLYLARCVENISQIGFGDPLKAWLASSFLLGEKLRPNAVR